jgi:hypothetical protein
MNRILLINETFLLLRNQSVSTGYEQLSCISNVKIWIIIHFIIKLLIESLLLSIVCLFQFIMVLFCYCYWRRIRNFMQSNWLDIHNLDTYSLMIIVLKKEMKLIFIYAYIAFLYTWLDLVNSKYTLTYLNFLRWLIEASLLPYVLTITLFGYFLCIENFPGTYHLFYAPSIITKVPLFILMRYAEIQSDVFLNRLQILLFNAFCYWPSK